MPNLESQQPATPSPDPQYDFIFNDQQKQQPRFKLGFPRPSKPMLIGAALLAAIALFVSLFVFSGGSDSNLPVISAVARGQEIARVSSLVQEKSSDPNTKALASTVNITLRSEQISMISYLEETGVRVEQRALLEFQDKATDEMIESATQENRLEETYYTYLKGALTSYKNALQDIASEASPQGRNIINASLFNTEILLSSPQLNS